MLGAIHCARELGLCLLQPSKCRPDIEGRILRPGPAPAEPAPQSTERDYTSRRHRLPARPRAPAPKALPVPIYIAPLFLASLLFQQFSLRFFCWQVHCSQAPKNCHGGTFLVTSATAAQNTHSWGRTDGGRQCFSERRMAKAYKYSYYFLCDFSLARAAFRARVIFIGMVKLV